MKLLLYPLYPAMSLWWGVSAGLTGVKGFRPLFRTGCLEMAIVSDFLILDCWLPGKVKRMIKGAEQCSRTGFTAKPRSF